LPLLGNGEDGADGGDAGADDALDSRPQRHLLQRAVGALAVHAYAHHVAVDGHQLDAAVQVRADLGERPLHRRGVDRHAANATVPAMPEIDRLLAANHAYAAAPRDGVPDARPSRRLAVVTCMDARIDVFAVLGLRLGESHVIRNAGGRVTEDVVRSLALSSHVLGVDTVVVMQHTRCGLAGVTEEELRERTGADLGFLTIADHATALREDVDALAATPYLGPVTTIAGLVYDVETGAVDDVVRWERG
jgi:carbonic anhydrase